MTYSIFTDGSNYYLGDITTQDRPTSTIDHDNFYKNMAVLTTYTNLELETNPIEGYVRQSITTAGGRPLLYGMSHSSDTNNLRYAGRIKAKSGTSEGIRFNNENGFPTTEPGLNAATTENMLYVHSNQLVNNNFLSTTTITPLAFAAYGSVGTPLYFVYTVDDNSIGMFFWKEITNAVVTSPLVYKMQGEFNYTGILQDIPVPLQGQDPTNYYVTIKVSAINGYANSYGMIDKAAPANTTGYLVLIASNIDGTPTALCAGEFIDTNYDPNTILPGVTTDFKVYNGNTYIGKLPNLRIGTGVFQIGKPVHIEENTTMSKAWLPVGIIQGRTLLMRTCSTNLINTNITAEPTPTISNFYPDYCPLSLIGAPI